MKALFLYRMDSLSKDMKKIILIIDILLIVITTILLFYYNYSDSYGLAAMEDAVTLSIPDTAHLP